MIDGYVDENFQPKVSLALMDRDKHESAIEAVVDTGFSGHLCVSVFEMHKIDLKFRRIEKFELGNGKIVTQKVFRGQLIFDGQKRFVNVIVSKSRDTLIGASLLANKKLEIDYTNKSARIRNSKKKPTPTRR